MLRLLATLSSAPSPPITCEQPVARCKAARTLLLLRSATESALLWCRCAGAVLITVSNGPTLSALFTMFVIVQTIYGVGVGGEYPVASSSANERANSYKCGPARAPVQAPCRRCKPVCRLLCHGRWGGARQAPSAQACM